MNNKITNILPKVSRVVYSQNKNESRQKVLCLYKRFLRKIPNIIELYANLPLTYNAYRNKIREEFTKNKSVSDIRAIDMLIHRGENDLADLLNLWKQGCHVMNYFKYTENPKPKDFMGKFLSGSTSSIQ
ncbi:unnamed protein product [Gordionus sp. m RMFG-2023]|uniref:NADH dehydrogenase [ubiquinone] 1 alpha subcomplex subunit 6-like n=1 Tax=Gordionus sp. m RMFG-2023 TaxID=3053472 RepID=UPI0030E0BEEB